MNRFWALLERSYPLLVALLVIATMLPMWLADWLPLNRWGDVLASLDVMWRLDDPSASYAGRFIPPDALDPNTLSLRFAALFGPLLGTLTVAKLLASFGLGLLPLAMGAVARGFGRSRWLVFLLAPLAWGGAMHEGALDIVVALPLLFAALAQVQRLTEPNSPGSSKAGPALKLLGLFVALYFADLTIFLAAWVLSLTLLVSSCSLRDAWIRLPLWILPLPLVAGFLSDAEFGLTQNLPPSPNDVGLPAERFLSFPSDILGLFSDAIDDRVLAILLGGWLIAMLMPRSASFPTREEAGNPSWRRFFRLELLAAVALLLYLFVPNTWGEVEWLGNRFGVVALALLLITPRIDWSGGHRRWAIVGFIALAATYISIVNVRLTVFGYKTGARLAALLDELPDDSRLGLGTRLTDAWPTGANGIATLPAGIHAVMNGREAESWRPRSYRALRHVAGESEPSLTVAELGTHMVYAFDHVLVDSPKEAKLMRQRQGVTERARWGPWTLFDVQPPRPAVEVVPSGVGPVTYRWHCPPRHHLVGLDLSPGLGTFEGIRPYCRRWQSPSDDNAKSRSFRPMAGPQWGPAGSIDALLRLRCPDGSVVIGLRGTLAPTVGIAAVSLRCSRSNNSVTYASPPTESMTMRAPPLLGIDPPTRAFRLECPGRHLAIGLRVLEDDRGRAPAGLGLACLRPADGDEKPARKKKKPAKAETERPAADPNSKRPAPVGSDRVGPKKVPLDGAPSNDTPLAVDKKRVSRPSKTPDGSSQ